MVTKQDSGAFEVIDGQQRLTTLFISLCAFKRLFKDSPKHLGEVGSLLASQKSNERGEFSQSRHLDLQYEDSSEILDTILEEKDFDNKLTGSSRNIKEAFETVYEYLEVNFQRQEDLIKFYGYFMHKVIFVQIETPSVSDALKIFETINERGVGLNPMDLLKNLIFRQLEKGFSEN